MREKWVNYVKDHPDALTRASINVANRYDDMAAAMIAVLICGKYDTDNKEFEFADDEKCMQQYLRIYKEIQGPINQPYCVQVVNDEGITVTSVYIIYKFKELKNWRHPKNDNL